MPSEEELEQIYASLDHYFPDDSFFCVKCGCSHSAARGQPCVPVQPMAVMC